MQKLGDGKVDERTLLLIVFVLLIGYIAASGPMEFIVDPLIVYIFGLMTKMFLDGAKDAFEKRKTLEEPKDDMQALIEYTENLK